MNHIFYKLANDAWIDAPDGGGYDGKIFSKEKFAELIVRECAAVAFDAVANGDLVEDSILEHFGVGQ